MVTKPRVLVVDDEQDCRTMLTALLEFEGFAVTTAANGREALAAARKHHPCVILLDLMMPGMTGEQFRAVQMQDSVLRDIPVVVVSACYDAARIAEHLHAGFVSKPFDAERLLELVEEQCHA